MSDDTRNVIDRFKDVAEADIIEQLDTNGVVLHVAIENVERDFNMGTIVRNANAFGVRHVHVIGRRQWNKRGAMATDKYLHLHYHESVQAFVDEMRAHNRAIIAVDNQAGAVALSASLLPENAVLVFGGEGPGLSQEMIAQSERMVAIEQFGSTRSVNVGVASGIAMYAWLQQHKLT